jgi:hypothetical protein
MSTAAPRAQTIDVTFCLDLGGDDCVNERELGAHFETYRERLVGDDRFSGAIVLAPGNGPAVKYEDELGPAVQDLCFRSIPALLAGKTVNLTTFSYPGNVRLAPEGDAVVISGDVVRTAILPLRPLAHGLYDCGVRFIAFARRLKGKDYEHILQPLEDLGRQAAQALASAGDEG